MRIQSTISKLMIASLLLTFTASGPSSKPPSEETHDRAKTTPLVEDVLFRNGTDSLSGTLYKPAGAGPFAAVALIYGSDGVDRDNGGVGPALGRHLARNGFACLTWDRPGVGKSTGNFLKQTFHDRTNEALGAVRFLQGRPDIRRDAVGLWGHSQGGMVVPLAASRSKDVAFLIEVSGWQGPAWKQDLVRVEAQLRADQFPEADVLAAVALAKRRMDLIRSNGSFEELDNAQEAAERMSWFPYVHRCDRALFDSAKSLVEYDTAPSWDGVHCPVLVIYGDKDTSSGPPDALLAVIRHGLETAGNADVTVKIFPNAEHSLCNSQTGGPKEAGERKKLRKAGDAPDFVPGYLDAMTTWLAARFGDGG
jgi:pimeloyl-ACP methyl ester carboxylesterase